MASEEMQDQFNRGVTEALKSLERVMNENQLDRAGMRGDLQEVKKDVEFTKNAIAKLVKVLIEGNGQQPVMVRLSLAEESIKDIKSQRLDSRLLIVEAAAGDLEKELGDIRSDLDGSKTKRWDVQKLLLGALLALFGTAIIALVTYLFTHPHP